MKVISLECAHCGISFEKAHKEYNRQIKKNPDRVFYCSLQCSGKSSHDHLLDHEKYIFTKEDIIRAQQTNQKYSKEEKPFAEYLRRARQRKHICDLSIQYLVELWDKQNGRCAISNIPISLYSESPIHKASLDRKNSSLGYIEGNVQFLSCCINYAKNSMSDEDALVLMNLICENYG